MKISPLSHSELFSAIIILPTKRNKCLISIYLSPGGLQIVICNLKSCESTAFKRNRYCIATPLITPELRTTSVNMEVDKMQCNFNQYTKILFPENVFQD